MPVKSPRYALFDLEESESYSFRVRCCNSAGVSEASGSTSNITVGDKLGQQETPLYPPLILWFFDYFVILLFCSLVL
jgi:hypothetical protein